MPLLYYARQSQLKTKDGAKQWHLTLKKIGRAVSLQQLGELVAALHVSPEYTRPAALGTTSGGGNSGGDGGLDENPSG